jgi:hypothetical protein
MTTRSLVIVASAALATGLITLSYLLGTHHHPTGAAVVMPVTTAAAPLPQPSDPVAVHDPVATAIAWLRAYRGLQWRDPSPSSWVDRVRPYVGDDLAAQDEQARQGTAGPSWTTFVHDQCTATAREVGGVIPAEAPRAPDSVYVQVSGTVVTECAAGTPPVAPEPVAATVEVRRVADGRWVVQRRLF